MFINLTHFMRGNSGLIRESINNITHSFSVLDNIYLSARWAGNAYHFSFEFLKLINKANMLQLYTRAN